MKTVNLKLVTFTLLLICLPGLALAAGSLLRVTCEGTDIGAEVHVNGKFKGECPIDVAVPEGMLKLRVIRSIDASHEQLFEQETRIGEGVVKKIEVQLSEPRLTAAAQRVEDTRVAAEREAKEAKQRDEADKFTTLLTAAKGGDAKAMLAVGARYQNGHGVTKDLAEGLEWLKRAAAAGNELARFLATRRYQKPVHGGDREAVKAVRHLLALPKENQRTVEVRGVDKIKDFMASDPFFAMTAISEPKPTSFSYKKSLGIIGSNMMSSVTGTCRRDGNFAKVESRFTTNGTSADLEELAALGGLVARRAAADSGFLSPSKIAWMLRIISVYGQPFPLVADKRFGLSYVQDESGTEVRYDVDCMAGFDKEAVTELVCVTQFELLGKNVAQIRRWSFDESSGCLRSGYVE